MLITNKNLDHFRQKFRWLPKKCDFKSVTVEKNQDVIKDALITGFRSRLISYRLLEHASLGLHMAFEQTRPLEIAVYIAFTSNSLDSGPETHGVNSAMENSCTSATISLGTSECSLGGFGRHSE